jgi:hypothetical protein
MTYYVVTNRLDAFLAGSSLLPHPSSDAPCFSEICAGVNKTVRCGIKSQPRTMVAKSKNEKLSTLRTQVDEVRSWLSG